MGKKLMILGASILQLPAIKKAKEMGLFVIAVDIDKNAIGFKEADIGLEISTIDIPKVVDAAKKFEIDGIMTLASDMPMRTVANVAKKLNIIGISEETAVKATNKIYMRQCLKECNVAVPLFLKVKSYDQYLSAIETIKGKVIVKPADNSGSRGVVLIQNTLDMKEIKRAYDYSINNSRSGEIIVEEFMQGPEVSVEAISLNGQVHIIAITDKVTTGAPNFVEMGHSQPSRLSPEVKEKISKLTISAVKAIGIDNGPSHTEIIVTNEGPKIVEIGARLGGDNITTHLVPLSTGIDMVECCIRICLGDTPDLSCKYIKSAAIRYLPSCAGILREIYGVDEVKSMEGVKQVTLTKGVGDRIDEIVNSSDRIGFIIAQADTVNSTIEICEQGLNKLKIVIN